MTSNTFKHKKIISDKPNTIPKQSTDVGNDQALNLSFIEKYIIGWGFITIDCDIQRVATDNGNLHRDVGINDEIDNGKFNFRIIFNRHFGDFDSENSWYQKPMLIYIAESVECPEMKIPSLIRLYPIQNNISDSTGGLPDSLIRKSVNQAFSRFTDREVNMTKINTTGIFRDDLNSDEIKCRPQIMDSITNNKGDVLWSGFSHIELQEVLSSISIFLDGNKGKITFRPIQYARIKRIKMIFNSFDF